MQRNRQKAECSGDRNLSEQAGTLAQRLEAQEVYAVARPTGNVLEASSRQRQSVGSTTLAPSSASPGCSTKLDPRGHRCSEARDQVGAEHKKLQPEVGVGKQ